MIAFGALSGGVASELSGGNFWQGAITGGIVAGLNHAMHRLGGPGDGKKKLKDLKENPPNHPDYEAPKSGAKKVRNPNGKGWGWVDKKGNVWVPTDHNGTHAPHWDKQNPRTGNHENVYPQSEYISPKLPMKNVSDFSQMGNGMKKIGIVYGTIIVVLGVIILTDGAALLAL